MITKPAQRLTLFLLLAPALLWLGLLIVLPHVEILVLSFSERVLIFQKNPSRSNRAIELIGFSFSTSFRLFAMISSRILLIALLLIF